MTIPAAFNAAWDNTAWNTEHVESEPVQLPDSTVLNPVDLETAIRDVSRRMHKGITVITRLNHEYKAAKREHDLVRAQAYVAHDGPQSEKRMVAELATAELRVAMDEAKVKLDYARDLADTLHKEMSGLQTINASVRAMYQTERGVGG